MGLRALARRLFGGPPSAAFEQVEQAERRFYAQNVRVGMTVFDVGANIGELTMTLSALVGHGSVHAFEPAPAAFNALTKRLRLSGAANVTANELAVVDQPGAVVLNCYEGPYHEFNSLAARPLADYGIDAGQSIRVPVQATTLDAYCAERGIAWIDLLKIDVEGAELQVLRGASGLFAAKRVAVVIFEFGQTTFDMGNTPAALVAFCRGHGYGLANLIAADPLFPGGRSARTARFAMHVARPR